MAKCSVIVPAYNVENFIERCIQSVLKQSFPDWELLLIDDGSTDGTPGICKKYAEHDHRIRYQYQANQGQGIARNTGVSISDGNYIFFLDADDWIQEDTLEKLYRYAEEYETDIVFFDYFEVEQGRDGQVNERLSKMPIKIKQITNCLETPVLFYCLEGAVWNKFYRSSILDGIEQAGHPYEDSAIIPCIMSRAERIGQLQEAFYYHWGIREDSTVNTSSSVYYLKDCITEVYQYFYDHKNWNDYQDALRKYSEWMLLVAKNQVKRQNTPGGELFLEECQQLIDVYYPSEGAMRSYQFAVWGSYNLRCIVNRTQRNLRTPRWHFCFANITSLMAERTPELPTDNGESDERNGGCGSVFPNRKKHNNSYRESMIRMDEEQQFRNLSEEEYREIDFVCIDLLEERFLPVWCGTNLLTGSDALTETLEERISENVSENGWNSQNAPDGFDNAYLTSREWRRQADAFIAFMQSHFQPEQIILVENYLCEAYGTYAAEQEFPESKEIQRMNDQLKSCYEYFEKNYEGIYIIRNTDKELEYTDKEYPHGRHPWHQNEYYYYGMAEQVEKVLSDGAAKGVSLHCL